eukprot:PhM_4_TR8847/c0_g1_i1/m.5400
MGFLYNAFVTISLTAAAASATAWCVQRGGRALKRVRTQREADTTAVVYDPRRMRIVHIAFPSESKLKIGTKFDSVSTHAAVWHLPHHCVWLVPSNVLCAATAATTTLHLVDIKTSDGVTMRSVVVKASYFVMVEELPRYLTVVGPQPPTQALGATVSSMTIDSLAMVPSTVLMDRVSRERGVQVQLLSAVQKEVLRLHAVSVVDLEIVSLQQ